MLGQVITYKVLERDVTAHRMLEEQVVGLIYNRHSSKVKAI